MHGIAGDLFHQDLGRNDQMAETKADFAELLERARRNDHDATTALCLQYEPKLRVVARVLLGPALRPHLDSVDLVQSVHRAVIVGLNDDKFDLSTPEQLIALALGIVRRKVARHWRKARRQQRLSTGATGIDPLPLLLQNLGSDETDPAVAIQSRDQIEVLCQQLSETEREMLQMRADGYSTAEIAERLQLNNTTLRVRMTRLRERLRSNNVTTDWL
jgi:RNA polymerase sigma-70 factor (ECF subfamily)